MPADSVVRVLVLTAPVGEGHMAAARAVEAEVVRHDPDADVVVCDVLREFNRPLRWLLHDAYRWQLRTAPWLFGVVFGGLQRSRVLRWLSRTLLSVTGSRPVLRLVADHRPDVIVSTFPATTAILGCLRLRGKVRVPVCAAITDFAGVELWADPGVDIHLVMHESLLAKVERVAGIGSAPVVSPLVAAEFLVPRDRSEARRSLGLPTHGRVVVVSGGGWGVGDLEGATDTALADPDVSVVCLAGRNDDARIRLEESVGTDPRVTVLGFTDRMSDLLAAADLLVHSTGGVTCLEGLARGCPIVAFGAPAGHAPSLAREMAALGLLTHARTNDELRAALSATPASPEEPANSAEVSSAEAVLEARTRVRTRMRARVARPVATVGATVVLVLAVFSSDLTFPIVAEAFRLPDTTTVANRPGAVALVVEADRQTLIRLAPIARRARLSASVATPDVLSPADVSTLRRTGLVPIPEVAAVGRRWSLSAERRLGESVRAYGLEQSRFYYIAPNEGFTITEFLLARHLGGRPLQASTMLGQATADALPRGAIVKAPLAPGAAAAAQLVRSWQRLARSVPVTAVPAHPAPAG